MGMDRKNQGAEDQKAGSRTQQPMHVGKSCSGRRQHVGHCCNDTCTCNHPCVQPVGLSCHLTAPGKGEKRSRKFPLMVRGQALLLPRLRTKGRRNCFKEYRKIKGKKDEFHHTLLDRKPTLFSHSKGIDLISRSASFCFVNKFTSTILQ